VSTLNRATGSVLVQGYSFMSAPIAEALVEAHRRGVQVVAILKKGQSTERH
jgi:phosphatidylserine/phosphatidylglycerophosphate/cardiolipin synthase-like enzyme